MSYKYFPNEFSSYEDYVEYLKEKGLALEAPKGSYEDYVEYLKEKGLALEAPEEIYD